MCIIKKNIGIVKKHKILLHFYRFNWCLDYNICVYLIDKDPSLEYLYKKLKVKGRIIDEINLWSSKKFDNYCVDNKPIVKLSLLRDMRKAMNNDLNKHLGQENVK